MTECAYCDTDLPDAKDHTEQMDILKTHVWTEHGELFDEVVTGDISAGTYAQVEARFLSRLGGHDTEVVEDGA